MKHILTTYLISIMLSACNTSSILMNSIMVEDGLSEEEVVNGLKTALNIGTEKAVNIVSNPDGFLGDQAIKILLPSELKQAIDKLRNAPGGEQIYRSTISPVVEDMVVALNRSASDAAREAVPIFKNAITSMSIQDGWSILKGQYKNAGNVSATTYFKDKTQEDLQDLFKPKINSSLNKPLTGNTSANTLYNTFVSAYNAVLKSPANLLMKLDPIQDPDLASYVTGKATDGLFLKIADEEKEIRDDPYRYANKLIEKVFGNDTL